MFISIVLMVLVDFIIKDQTGIVTNKLDIPDNFDRPSDNRQSWFIRPLGNNFNNNNANGYLPLWVPFLSIFPALLVFIVLYFEVEVTG